MQRGCVGVHPRRRGGAARSPACIRGGGAGQVGAGGGVAGVHRSEFGLSLWISLTWYQF
jgi:hypothetical protein